MGINVCAVDRLIDYLQQLHEASVVGHGGVAADVPASSTRIRIHLQMSRAATAIAAGAVQAGRRTCTQTHNACIHEP